MSSNTLRIYPIEFWQTAEVIASGQPVILPVPSEKKGLAFRAQWRRFLVAVRKEAEKEAGELVKWDIKQGKRGERPSSRFTDLAEKLNPIALIVEQKPSGWQVKFEHRSRGEWATLLRETLGLDTKFDQAFKEMEERMKAAGGFPTEQKEEPKARKKEEVAEEVEPWEEE